MKNKPKDEKGKAGSVSNDGHRQFPQNNNQKGTEKKVAVLRKCALCDRKSEYALCLIHRMREFAREKFNE